MRRDAPMSVIEFFEYLAEHEHSAELAHELADAWAENEIADLYEPAA
jgi:hypothetical protein